jgi:hypothetical protein
MHIRREIFWISGTASDADVRAKQMESIKTLRSGDPAIAYNRTPKFIRQAS